MKRKGGFTFIELVIAVTILAILAAVAIPTFQNIQTQARNAVLKGVVGSVRVALMLYRMNEVVSGREGAWPWPNGDRVMDVEDGGVLSRHVMANGNLPDNPWARDAGKTDPDSMGWYFNCNPQGTLEPTDFAWIYDQCNGGFWANTNANGGPITENNF